jgi:hypothetical protein
MIEEYRKAGRPVPPSVERMAAFLDSVDSQDSQEVPMVKPGGRDCCCLSVWWCASCISSTACSKLQALGQVEVAVADALRSCDTLDFCQK